MCPPHLLSLFGLNRFHFRPENMLKFRLHHSIYFKKVCKVFDQKGTALMPFIGIQIVVMVISLYYIYDKRIMQMDCKTSALHFRLLQYFKDAMKASLSAQWAACKNVVISLQQTSNGTAVFKTKQFICISRKIPGWMIYYFYTNGSIILGFFLFQLDLMKPKSSDSIHVLSLYKIFLC